MLTPVPHLRPGAGVELPVFARHEYRTRKRDKWAVGAVARRRRGKLEPQPARQPEGRFSGLAVCRLVRELIWGGLVIACGHGINRVRRKCQSDVCRRQKGDDPDNRKKRSAHKSLPSERQVLGLWRANHPLRSRRDGPDNAKVPWIKV